MADLLLSLAAEFRDVDTAAADARLDELALPLFGSAGGDLRAAAAKLASVLDTDPGFDADRTSVAAASARILDKNFEASALALRLGKSESPIAFNADRLRGTFSGSGISGTFAGATSTIGTVPLQLSDGEGRWRIYDGDVTVNAGLLVSDRAPDPRVRSPDPLAYSPEGRGRKSNAPRRYHGRGALPAWRCAAVRRVPSSRRHPDPVDRQS